MKLTDLDPRWFDVPGIGTNKDGLTFLCPCANCQADPNQQSRIGVQFANPVQGGIGTLMGDAERQKHQHELRTFDVGTRYLWQRTGETFLDMTLSPSVDCSNSGHWHGFISSGEIK